MLVRAYAPALVGAFLVCACGGNSGGGDAGANDNNRNQTLCGDGVMQTGEECDDGVLNSDDTPDACRTDCILAHCGDGTVDASEMCDDGIANSDVLPDACRADCNPPSCGDLVVDIGLGELCDDGNTQSGDRCSDVCQPEFCGNGFVDTTLGEECDDGSFEPGDGCGPSCLTERCGNGFLDPGESCDSTDLTSHDGCSSGCITELPRWREIKGPAPVSTFFPLGYGYDAALVISSIFDSGVEEQRLWRFDGAWTPDASPTPFRATGSGVFDPDRQRLVVFSTATGVGVPTYLDETWEYDGTSWSLQSPATSPPPYALGHMVYDSARQRVVLHGGGTFAGPSNETWEYDGATWTQVVTPTSPPLRWLGAMVYDSIRGRTVLFGGCSTFDFNSTCVALLDDTWEYDGVDWSNANPATRPTPRMASPMGYDPSRGLTALYGGCIGFTSGICTVMESDTWEYDGATWSARTPAFNPGPVFGGKMIFDSGANRLTGLFLGSTTSQWWQFDGTNWRLTPSPWRRQAPGLTYSPDIAAAILFGGGEHSDPLDDTWTFDGQIWQRIATASAPPARNGPGLAYDTSRGQALLFGGHVGLVPLDDTWTFDGADWTELTPANRPPALTMPLLAYDTGRDRSVLVGFEASGLPFSLQTWEFDGADWSQSVDSPVASAGKRLVYDPTQQRMLMVGYLAGFDNCQHCMWEYDGTAWAQIVTTVPAPRVTSPAVTHDPGRGVTILFAGCVDVAASTLECLELSDEVWEFDGTDWAPIGVTSLPNGRWAGAMTFDTVRRQALLVSGQGLGPDVLADTWIYQLTSAWPDEQCDNNADDDSDGATDCADPDCWGLPCSGGAGCVGGVCP